MCCSQVKIADFGIARVLDYDSTGTSAREKAQMLRTVAGTPAYVAPEIIRMRRAPAHLQMMTGGGDEATMGDFVNDYEDISRLGGMIGVGGLRFEVGSHDSGSIDKDGSGTFFEVKVRSHTTWPGPFLPRYGVCAQGVHSSNSPMLRLIL